VVADHHSLWLLGSAPYSNQVQLWRWTAGTWAVVPATTPGPRLFVFFEPKTAYEILVFGGLNEGPGTGGTLNTAEWAWSGKSWRRIH